MRQPIIRILAVTAAALAAVGLAAGCSSQNPSRTDTGSTTATTPPAGEVALQGPTAFAATIDGGAALIDVRTPAEFAAGHLEGAVNLDIADTTAFAAAVAELDPAGDYAVYCRSGNRSATATAYLVDQGFTSVAELDGGIVAWQSAGLPVSTS